MASANMPCMSMRNEHGCPGLQIIWMRCWRRPWPRGAPLRRQMLSAPNGAGTDGASHAYPAYPDLRKERATRECQDGHVGGSHRSSEWSTQDMCGESCIA